MTDRQLIYIVKDQRPLVLSASDTVRKACASMWERRAGSVLIVDRTDRLIGIFTGRDAVRLLANSKAKSKDVGAAPLSDAMTRDPHTVTPQCRALEALRAMSEGDFRHVPVTDNGAIRGVVSRGDFKGMEFEEYRWRAAGGRSGSAANRTLSEIVKARKPLMLSADATVAEACKSMCKSKGGPVLVIDKRGRLKGIFTGRDAVRALAKSKAAATMCLAKAMTPDPATMRPEFHAVDALRTMNDGGFRHIPVVDHGKVLGVVSRHDFTGVEIDRLDEEEHLKECIW